jgi:DNA-binding XRE family transcriptional regulator
MDDQQQIEEAGPTIRQGVRTMQQGALIAAANRLNSNGKSGGGGRGDLPTIIRQDRALITPYGIASLNRYRVTGSMTWQQLADFLGIPRKTIWSWYRPDDPVATVTRAHIALVLRKTRVDITRRRGSR